MLVLQDIYTETLLDLAVEQDGFVDRAHQKSNPVKQEPSKENSFFIQNKTCLQHNSGGVYYN